VRRQRFGVGGGFEFSAGKFEDSWRKSTAIHGSMRYIPPRLYRAMIDPISCLTASMDRATHEVSSARRAGRRYEAGGT
jgi:hypothetical protein